MVERQLSFFAAEVVRLWTIRLKCGERPNPYEFGTPYNCLCMKKLICWFTNLVRISLVGRLAFPILNFKDVTSGGQIIMTGEVKVVWLTIFPENARTLTAR